MEAKPKRRWFAFRLRTLFAVVAVVGLGIWIGQSLYWIRQRQGAIFIGGFSHFSNQTAKVFCEGYSIGAVTAPAGLWLFGEQGIGEVRVRRPRTEDARRLFPEAKIVEIDEFGWPMGAPIKP